MKWQIVFFTFLIGCLLYTCSYSVKVNEKVVIKTDTITITKIDTVIDTVPVEKIVERKVIDTMRIHTSDTMYVVIDREQRVFEGEQYRAYVSGYRPVLDSIHIYSKTNTVYVETERAIKQRPKRFGLGVQVGYGFAGARAAPYVGIGVHYNLLSF
ncbi:MAG: DUF6808 domain-containing protein [Tannerellaceae bacterium]